MLTSLRNTKAGTTYKNLIRLNFYLKNAAALGVYVVLQATRSTRTL